RACDRSDVRVEEGVGRHDGAGVAPRWVPRTRVLGLRLLLQHRAVAGGRDRRRAVPSALAGRDVDRDRARFPGLDAGAAVAGLAATADRPPDERRRAADVAAMGSRERT